MIFYLNCVLKGSIYALIVALTLASSGSITTGSPGPPGSSRAASATAFTAASATAFVVSSIAF